MQTEMVGGLLLPIGLWLLLSAGTPSQLHRRLATASLVATAIATLTFVAFGFAFAFGARELAFGIGAAPERWVFIGLSGFLLDGATNLEGLAQFVRFWPLIASGALVVAGTLAQQGRLSALAVFTVVVAGFILPVIGCWMWGGGWLSALGANAGLGRGVVDLGHLSAIGVAAGGAIIAWLRTIPRRELALREPELPVVHFPVRAVAGVLLAMASAPAFTDNFSPDAPALSMGQFVNSSVAVSIAILTTGVYTVFTTRRTDVLSASRAALAAVFIVSSGGALLPMPVVVVLGVACGLLATIGYYAINEKLRWRDDSAIVTTVFAPAAIGLVATGTFANGAFGVTGLLSRSGGFETGQLFAQSVGLVAIASFAMGVSSAAVWLMCRIRMTLLIPRETVYSQPLTPQPALSPVAIAATDFADVGQSMNLTYASVSDTSDSASPVRADPVNSTPVAREVEPATLEQKARGWFDRFRRSEAASPVPKQPRKVAYPYRVGGRPLAIRPPSTNAGDAKDDVKAPRSDHD